MRADSTSRRSCSALASGALLSGARTVPEIVAASSAEITASSRVPSGIRTRHSKPLASGRADSRTTRTSKWPGRDTCWPIGRLWVSVIMHRAAYLVMVARLAGVDNHWIARKCRWLPPAARSERRAVLLRGSGVAGDFSNLAFHVRRRDFPRLFGVGLFHEGEEWKMGDGRGERGG